MRPSDAVCHVLAQEHVIPVAAEYDRSMKYPQPVFDKAWEVRTVAVQIWERLPCRVLGSVTTHGAAPL